MDRFCRKRKHGLLEEQMRPHDGATLNGPLAESALGDAAELAGPDPMGLIGLSENFGFALKHASYSPSNLLSNHIY